MAAHREASGRRAAGTGCTARFGARIAPGPADRLASALESGRGQRRMPAVPTLVALVATTGVVVGSLIVSAGLDGLVADAERYGQPWDVFVTSIHEAELAEAGQLLSEDGRVAGVDLARGGELNVTTADGMTTQVGRTGSTGDRSDVAGRARRTYRPAGRQRSPSIADDGPARPRSRRQHNRQRCVRRTHGDGRRSRHRPSDPSGDPDHGSVVTGDLFDELCAAELIAEIDREYSALIRLHDPADTDAVLDELFPEAAFTQLPGVPSSVTALAEIGQVPRIVATLVALIGIAAAANSLVLVGRRRGGDLAVLRALGLRPLDVRRAFGWQAATMAMIAAALEFPPVSSSAGSRGRVSLDRPTY